MVIWYKLCFNMTLSILAAQILVFTIQVLPGSLFVLVSYMSNKKPWSYKCNDLLYPQWSQKNPRGNCSPFHHSNLLNIWVHFKVWVTNISRIKPYQNQLEKELNNVLQLARLCNQSTLVQIERYILCQFCCTSCFLNCITLGIPFHIRIRLY